MDQVPVEPGAFYLMDRGYMVLRQLDRIHHQRAYFVIRAKSTLKFKRQYSRPKADQPNIVYDQLGVFSVPSSFVQYPHRIRCIKSVDPNTGKAIVLLTNHLDLQASQLATLYTKRWQVELFFKWIKQHLRIKVFWGENMNAVYTQLWSALASYLIVAIIRKRLGIEQNMNEMLQILSVSLFDKTPLNQLFTNTALQNQDNDQPNQLRIFDL